MGCDQRDRLRTHAFLRPIITTIAKITINPLGMSTARTVSSVMAILSRLVPGPPATRIGSIPDILLGGEYPGTREAGEFLSAGIYGVEAIPAAWRERVARREEITDLASRLPAAAEGDANHPRSQTQM